MSDLQPQPLKQEAVEADRRPSPVHVLSFYSKPQSVNAVCELVGEVCQGRGIASYPYAPEVATDDFPVYIKINKADFVVLVSDMEEFKDVKNVPRMFKLYRDIFKSIDESRVTKFIFIVCNDRYYRDDDVNSSFVEKECTDLNDGILKSDKLKILSWGNSPCSAHHHVIAHLLGTSQTTTSKEPKISGGYSPLKSVSHYPESGAKYNKPHTSNPEHGYPYAPCRADVNQTTQAPHGTERWLRYKAVIRYGRVVEVLKCYPPEWNPDQFDLNLVYKDYQNEKEAILEFWEENGQTQPPIVVLGGMKKWPFLQFDELAVRRNDHTEKH